MTSNSENHTLESRTRQVMRLVTVCVIAFCFTLVVLRYQERLWPVPAEKGPVSGIEKQERYRSLKGLPRSRIPLPQTCKEIFSARPGKKRPGALQKFFECELSVEEVSTYYRTRMTGAGWQEKTAIGTNLNKTAGGRHLYFFRDRESLSVNIYALDDGGCEFRLALLQRALMKK